MNLTHPKEFYKNYVADNHIDDIDRVLISEIIKLEPDSAFEFGCGSGKNLKMIEQALDKRIETCGQDISILNCIQAHLAGVDSVICGDERHLPIRPFDVVFTCSVLDHIPHENINALVDGLKTMASKAVIVCETNSFDHNFYFRHDYAAMGFVKVGADMVSNGDGGIYQIFVFQCAEL